MHTCRICFNTLSSSKITVKNLAYKDTKTQSIYCYCNRCSALNLVSTDAFVNETINFDFFGRNRLAKTSLNYKFQKIRSSFFLGNFTVFGLLLAMIFDDPYSLKNYKKYLSKESYSLLDIGCADGKFIFDISYFNKNSKFLGIDPFINQSYTDANVTLTSNTLLLNEDKFDYITLNHVIEHLDNPEEILKSYIPYLKKDGLIIIRTPITSNPIYSIFRKSWVGFYSPYHRTIFNTKSLSYLIKKIGFQEVYSTTDTTIWSIISSIFFIMEIPFRYHLLIYLVILPIFFPIIAIFHILIYFLNIKGKGDMLFLIIERDNLFEISK